MCTGTRKATRSLPFQGKGGKRAQNQECLGWKRLGVRENQPLPTPLTIAATAKQLVCWEYKISVSLKIHGHEWQAVRWKHGDHQQNRGKTRVINMIQYLLRCNTKQSAQLFKTYVGVKFACAQKIMLNHGTIQHGKIIWQKCFLKSKWKVSQCGLHKTKRYKP